jgi:hypothetical protein
MNTFVRKQPKFQAVQMSGLTDDITARFMRLLGVGAMLEVKEYGNLEVSLLVGGERLPLKTGQWIVKADDGSDVRVLSSEEFDKEFDPAPISGAAQSCEIIIEADRRTRRAPHDA